MQMTGFPNGPPIRTFFPLINRITALHAAIGALAALREREFSGEGQAIDVSLADTGFTVNEIPITAYPADGTIQQREGNGRGPVNAYPTADGWIYLLASNQAAWERLCMPWRGQSGWRTLASPNRPGGKAHGRAGGGLGGVVLGAENSRGCGASFSVSRPRRSHQHR